MRRKARKVISIICAALMFSLFAGAVYAQPVLEYLRGSSIEITDQLNLVSNVYFNSAAADFAVENYYEYIPGEDLIPMVCYGNDIHVAASAARVYRLESEAGNTVCGIVNGGFFTLSSGIPLGPVIKEGIVRKSGYSESVIAFDERGDVRFTDLQLNIRLSFPEKGTSWDKLGFNELLSHENGLCLYSDDFGDTNGAPFETYNVVIGVTSGSAVLGGVIEGFVESSGYCPGKAELEDGKYMLGICAATPYTSVLSELQSLAPTERILIEFIADPELENTKNALGFNKWLVKDGAIEERLEKSPRAPRTAAGIRADGSFVLYTVDGRQKNYSMGFSLAELAERMLDLECVQAVNLDGGASTQLFATLPGYDSQIQINRDSTENGIRSSGNYIVFKNDAIGTGEPSKLYLYPYGEYLLSGASLQLELKAVDGAYKTCEIPGRISYSIGEGVRASIDETGLFKAGSETGQAVVNVRAGYASGSVTINIVSDPDEITAYLGESSEPEQLAAIGESYALSAEALYRMQELKSDAGCYSWSVEGEIGSIDEDGIFTAEGANGAQGSIICTAGNASASIQVELVRTTPTQLLQPWILEIVDAAAQPEAEGQIGQ